MSDLNVFVTRTPSLATRRLEPVRGFDPHVLAELWAFRELLYFLVWRDVKVRYKQTVLGAGWAIIQPLVATVVFTVFFGRLAKMPSDGLPYPVFTLAALVPWTYFASALSNGSGSVAGYQYIISKVYFPRLLIPIASVIAPLVDFAIAFAILLAVMGWYGVAPGAAVVWLPAYVALAAATAGAASFWLSAMNVRYRDIRYVVPFAVQIWLFATPVAYPASLVPERWRVMYGLNPMAAVIEGFRWALVGGPSPGALTLVSGLVVVIAMVTGVVYFRSVEGTFADII